MHIKKTSVSATELQYLYVYIDAHAFAHICYHLVNNLHNTYAAGHRLQRKTQFYTCAELEGTYMYSFLSACKEFEAKGNPIAANGISTSMSRTNAQTKTMYSLGPCVVLETAFKIAATSMLMHALGEWWAWLEKSATSFWDHLPLLVVTLKEKLP